MQVDSLKQIIRWHDDLKVNEPQIDSQHERIFRLAVEASELAYNPADYNALYAIFYQFGGVLEEHFRYEEDVLAKMSYPALEEHRAEHNAMLSEFDFIHLRLSSQGDAWGFRERRLAVVNFMLGVTIGHIVSSDANYVDQMQRWMKRTA